MSAVQDLISVYSDIATKSDHALHLGLTEAGMGSKGIVASTAAMGVEMARQGVVIQNIIVQASAAVRGADDTVGWGLATSSVFKTMAHAVMNLDEGAELSLDASTLEALVNGAAERAGLDDAAKAEAQRYAKAVTDNLGGRGIFGVELFIKGDKIYFSEVSPRPHDTGMVTMIAQDLSQFALHARAILGLPIPNIVQHGPSASAVILVEGESEQVSFGNLKEALAQPDTQLRLFGKPQVKGKRRMGVAVARGETLDAAREKAKTAAAAVEVKL